MRDEREPLDEPPVHLVGDVLGPVGADIVVERHLGGDDDGPARDSARVGQADLDRAADLTGAEDRLRRGGRPARHGPVRDPEHAAVPGAGQAAVGQLAIGQRPGHVAAPVGQHVYRAVGPDSHHGDLAEQLPYRLAL